MSVRWGAVFAGGLSGPFLDPWRLRSG